MVDHDGNEKRNEYDSNVYVEEEQNFSSNSLVEESIPSSNEGRISIPLAWM